MNDQFLSDKDKFIILLSPVFSNKLDKNDYPIEMEYGTLPIPVQQEVIEFLKSKEFTIKQVQNYVLSELQMDYNTYPKFNGIINDIEFEIAEKILIIHLYGELKEIFGKQEKHQNISYKEFDDMVKDMFWRVSHSGPLTQEYGNYLGESNGRYMIYFNTKRIKTDIIREQRENFVITAHKQLDNITSVIISSVLDKYDAISTGNQYGGRTTEYFFFVNPKYLDMLPQTLRRQVPDNQITFSIM